ncbi:hypothetical protein CWE15_11025 [Aliidiomarina taiwanensis]|uniref:Uncharacterized protein n=1 Tax=Aliidiomarina taiwanensis TaxID=946228 RepID=A0A432WVU0_9GAMM|nr:hypothetical protein [Aliidiomarina taiwanensis]RUO37886.1 hypothetical protein CWE15_11025 [Aliidiomarina taiwanensis]
MNTTPKLPKVLYLAMGGTLSAHHPQRTELRHYRTGHYNGQQLIAALPEAESLASITADDLPPQKARILLMLCIMAKCAEQDIQQAFETH